MSLSRIGLSKKLLIALTPAWFMASFVFIGVLISSLGTGQSSAQDTAVQASRAQPTYSLFAALPKKGSVLGQQVDHSDIRVLKLQEFFRFYHSPMVDDAKAFIDVADKYELPWTLLPAISCKESGCGRIIPINSYNAFGWAVYTGQNYGANFDSWAHGVEVVGKGIRENYFNRGYDTPEKMEVLYTPPSANSHHGWLHGVEYFMEELETWEIGSED